MADALGWSEADAIAANRAAPEAALDPVACQWVTRRPATTIVRSFRPDVVSPPGYRQKGDGPRQNQRGAVVVTVEETCILQGLRTDYPFRAKSETKLRSLVGAILPPIWGARILAPLVEMSQPAWQAIA
jgi:DNA (cytosine-5)-methyltransferase 1